MKKETNMLYYPREVTQESDMKNVRALYDGLFPEEFGFPRLKNFLFHGGNLFVASPADDWSKLAGLIVVRPTAKYGSLAHEQGTQILAIATRPSLFQQQIATTLLRHVFTKPWCSRERIFALLPRAMDDASPFFEYRGFNVAGIHRDSKVFVRELNEKDFTWHLT